MCAAMASFFGLMMVLMLGVKTSADGRSKIQNGFWLVGGKFSSIKPLQCREPGQKGGMLVIFFRGNRE